MFRIVTILGECRFPHAPPGHAGLCKKPHDLAFKRRHSDSIDKIRDFRAEPGLK